MPDKPKILFVEDDVPTFRAMKSLLGRDFSVRHAVDMATAFDCLGTMPGGIILDLMMPGGDGEELLGEVRRRKLPILVVVTTGVEDPARIDRVRAMGPDALLIKPYEFDELIASLASLRGAPC